MDLKDARKGLFVADRDDPGAPGPQRLTPPLKGVFVPPAAGTLTREQYYRERYGEDPPARA